MARRESPRPGAPCWVDLLTSDPEGADHFYAHLFGWEPKRSGDAHAGYTVFVHKGEAVAGAMGNSAESGYPDRWSVFLETGDAARTADSAAQHGGAVLRPAEKLGDVGSMSLLEDPGRSLVGAWQPGAHKGFGLIGEAGSPCWFELRSPEFDAALRFYEDVFGWDTHFFSAPPDVRYSTLGEGGSGMAGVMDVGREPPESTGWTVYFGVSDVDSALAAAESLGGSVAQPAEDSPHGKLAQVADPTGALFRIVGAR